MPTVSLPTSKYLQVADLKTMKEEERICVIIKAPTESNTNTEMLQMTVHNERLGDKEIYDFKNKFRDFFDAHGNNTDNWIGIKLLPILPEKNSFFFASYEIPDVKEQALGST